MLYRAHKTEYTGVFAITAFDLARNPHAAFRRRKRQKQQ